MKTRNKKDIVFIITAGVSITLAVVGFIIPPTGQIDGSVITTMGIMLAFYVAKQIPEAIIAGKEVRIKHGDTSVSVGDGKDLDAIESKE